MKEIIVNVDNYNENSIKTIEGDNLSEVYKIYICKNKRRIDLTNKIAVMAYVNEYGSKKSNILALNITNAAEGEIELPITNVISNENGVYACQIAIYGENNSLEQTAPFSLIVENNIFSKISNTAINSSDFHILSEAIKTTNAYGEKLKEGTENIELQYADKLNKKMNRDALLSMTNMGQDVKEAMTGGSVAVVGVDSISHDNVLKEGIQPINVNFMEVSSNLFNPLEIYTGTVSNVNGSFISSDTGYKRTGYIKIEPNNKYKFIMFSGTNASFRYAWFNDKYKFISGGTGDLSLQTSPGTAKFLVVCFSVDNYNNYYRYFLGENEEEFCMFDNSEIKKEYIDEDSKIIKKEIENIFNYSTVKSNYLININGNTQAKTWEEILALNTINNDYYQSDLIQVDYKKIYSAWYGANGTKLSLFRVIYWDKNKRMIKFESNISKIIINNKNIKYVSIANPNGYKPENVMLCEGEIFKEFKKYEEKIVLNNLKLIDESTYDWYAKKICTYGDSITQFGFWQKAVVDYHKFSEHYLRGLSGSKVSNVDAKNWWINADGSAFGTQESFPSKPEGTTLIKDYFCNTDRINTVPSDSDIILIMGGTNDFYSNVQLGDLEYNNGYKEETFKGALASTVMKMQNRLPNAVIVLMTIINGQGITNENNESVKVNSIGLKAIDYSNAIKEVAYYFGIPCIDIFGKAGINSWNRNKYISSDSIHPTYNILNSGSDQIARVVIGELKNIIPKFSKIIYDPNN
ncbi:SGNH/GDSL hydrolase family protein [Clostridium perfringens]|uniref:SGNH/GDSL hydrolase family protein n=1 Tax=Clostridium perfringens TaxID=1502 RepID=UPI000E12C3E3|nr:SGNH/GDSL hydrolase family protein [Clostridium perfringens]MDH5064923.1 GDSL-like Lipase/Acylhydrolase [Clostridium perfringens]UBK39429.1 SGNH/GDSL hydrolase family protein [Clostridium perfringens]UBK97627.1 SGNH/GDSL hydrolase family protein [Clostridium perfringens]SUY72663.1 lysophospholipase L1-like esterase [Clostridium perfringens]